MAKALIFTWARLFLVYIKWPGWGVGRGGGGAVFWPVTQGRMRERERERERGEVGTGKRGRRPESVINCAGKDERRGRILERVT